MPHKKFREALITFAIIAIPVSAFLMGMRESPLDYTLSMIGNWFGYKYGFILWGIVTSALISLVLMSIYKKTKFQNKKAYWFLYISAFFLILTVLVPTIHDEPIPKELREPLQLSLHGTMGILFAAFLTTSLYLFSKYLSKTNKEMSLESMSLLLLTVGGSIALLTIFGMTGIFELFFFTALSIFLIILNKNIKKIQKQK